MTLKIFSTAVLIKNFVAQDSTTKKYRPFSLPIVDFSVTMGLFIT
jgi:hypothetical protein